MAGEHILVVEDQRAVAGALKMRLRGLGYDVSAIAKDGQEAIDKAAELQPDLILMDIRLGEGIDGIEAARRIRSKQDIPVVYLSAHVDQQLLDRARSTRPAGFINKPFTTKDLFTAIDFALNNHGQAPAFRPHDGTLASASAQAEHDSDGLVSTDGEGRISYADRTAERITGMGRRFLIDRPLSELLSGLYQMEPAAADALVTRVLVGLEEERLQRPIQPRSGATRQQEDLLTPLFDSRGQCYGVALKLFTNSAPASEHRSGTGLEPALIQALDAVPHGIVCLNDELRVEHMNRCARDVLSRNRGLEIRNGVFCIQDRTLDSRLRECVRAAVLRGRERINDATGAMFVRAPMSGEHVELIVGPVPRNGPENQRGRAIIYLFDANSPRNASHDLLTGLYGLTHTEAKLVQLMSNGMMLDEAAQELAISVNTARTHLKHVFHKTGINRQAELVHRMGCGPASLLLNITPSTTRN